jgi:hypothetical protein
MDKEKTKEQSDKDTLAEVTKEMARGGHVGAKTTSHSSE